jgi:asparagine synthase (glutamine-hydrolysing)
VVLTGQGADEPWAGYRRYRGEQLAGTYQRLPALLRRAVVAPLVERLPRSEALKRAVRSLDEPDPSRRFSRIAAVFNSAGQAALRNGRAGVARPEDAVRIWQRDVDNLPGLAQMLYVDSRLSLADDLLLYGDKMSMAVSLEARVPMLDLDLMAFVERLPPALKLRHGVHKWLFRRAVAAWVPPEVLRRPKRGFETPMDRWLGTSLQGYVRDLWFSSDSAARRFFHVPYLEQLLGEHAAGRRDNRRQIFSLISFELWHRLFIDRQSPESLAA